MPTLHTVNKSPFERTALASCLGHVRPGDAVLLIEDGVVGARRGTRVAGLVESSLNTCQVYVLAPDLAARGLAADGLIEGVTPVDYSGFVELAASHDRTQAWL